MLFKITFNRALTLSFFWHIFCFFAVTIIIAPVEIGQRKLSDISFIGAILDKDSFHREFKDRHARSDIGHPKSNRFLSPAKEEITRPRLEKYAGREHLLKVKPYKFSIDEILEAEKMLPAGIKKELLLEPTDRDFTIEGPAMERAVLFKPPSPDYQGLISTSREDVIGEYYKVRLRIIIAADGEVKTVEKLTSSGYPEIDLSAIRYVKKWSFTPLSPDKPREDREEVVSLKFKGRMPEGL